MKNVIQRTASTLLGVMAIIGLAGAAAAAPIHFYGEVLTSTALPGVPGDVRAQLDVGLDPSADSILLNGSISPGDGLGSGYVAHGGFITYTHRFNPAGVVSSILGASLYIATVDDGWFDGSESVSISLDNQFWASGYATYNVFGGVVAASYFQHDGETVVRVATNRGDVNVVASLFKVVYDGGSAGGGSGASAVPEPGGMALFVTGLGVVGVARRRRG